MSQKPDSNEPILGPGGKKIVDGVAKGAKEAASAAAGAAKKGIDLMEAAGANRDHAQLPKSHRGHLKTIFGAAAACAIVGAILPIATTGIPALIGVGLLEAGKLMAYRGVRVLYPYSDKPLPAGEQLPLWRRALDFTEAAGINRDHPSLGASTSKDMPKLFGIAAVGIAGGLALTTGTVGVPALIGLAALEAGKFAAYRGYRVWHPYKPA